MIQAEELMQLLDGRSGFYRMLAGFYFKPLTQEQLDAMAAADFSAFDFDDEEMERGFRDMERYLAKRNSGTRSNLAVDYTSAFYGVHSYKGVSAVPYESAHATKHQLLMQESRQQVFRDYKQQALKLRGGMDLPDDHLSFELEYMAVLADRAGLALAQGDSAEALRNLVLSHRFLEEHLLSWFDTFRTRALDILTTRFYRGVLRVTGAFLQLDAEVLDDMISELSPQEAINVDEMDLAPTEAWVERYSQMPDQEPHPSSGSRLGLW